MSDYCLDADDYGKIAKLCGFDPTMGEIIAYALPGVSFALVSRRIKAARRQKKAKC